MYKIFVNIESIFNSTFGKLLTLGKNTLVLSFAGAGDLLNRHNIKAGYSSTSATSRVSEIGDKAGGYNKKLSPKIMNFPTFPYIISPSS